MPLTNSRTDKETNKLILDIASQYRPDSTNSKPIVRIEQLYVEAINNSNIRNTITNYVLQQLKDYE